MLKAVCMRMHMCMCVYGDGDGVGDGDVFACLRMCAYVYVCGETIKSQAPPVLI